MQNLFSDLPWMAVVPVFVDRCSLKLAQFNPLDSGGVEFLVGVKEFVGAKVSVRPIIRKAPLASHDVKSCVSQFPQAAVAMTANPIAPRYPREFRHWNVKLLGNALHSLLLGGL